MSSLSIVIPTLNEQDSVVQAIVSGWSVGAIEVLVVDGGSTDSTVRMAEAAGARVLTASCGRALQQNVGAQHATGDYLLFLHADTWLDEACGEQLATALAGGTLRVAAFQQRIDAPGWSYRLLEYANAARARWRGMAYGDQAIVVRRELFEQLGGFPNVPLMEEVYLMRELKRHGRRNHERRNRERLELLAGPLHVNARRWQRYGVVRQTIRNQALLAAERMGAPLETLARAYKPQDTSARIEDSQSSPSNNLLTESSSNSA